MTANSLLNPGWVARLNYVLLVILFCAGGIHRRVEAQTVDVLSDDFNDGVTDPEKWTVGTMSLYQGGSLTDLTIPVTEESDGRLRIVPREGINGLHYNGYVSNNAYDLTGGQFTVEVVQILNQFSTGEIFMSVGADGKNLCRYEIHMGQLRADFILNGNPIYTPVGAYSAANHRYLRIRHDLVNNIMLWEASPDRAQWSTLYTRVAGFSLANARVELFAGTYTAASSVGVALFDNAEVAASTARRTDRPLITKQPQAQTASVGQSVTFRVEVLSLEPVGYQWLFNSFAIAKATNASLTITNVKPENAGPYRVVVTNKNGLVISQPATLTLPADDQQPPSVTITSPASGVVSSENVTIQGVVSDNVGVTTLLLERNGTGPLSPVALSADGHFTTANLVLNRGTNLFRVIARDAAGNQGASSLTVVLEASRKFSVGDATAQEGTVLSAPIFLTSSGDVGAATLTISYDWIYLTEPDLQLSSNLSGWAQVNPGSPTGGVVRVSFALPGTTIPAGTQQIGTIRFRTRSVPFTLDTALGLQLLGAYSVTGDPLAAGTDVQSGVAHLARRKFTGDNNGNDRLDTGDASIILRLVAGIDPLQPWDVAANDLNANGMVDAGDALRVLRVAVNLDPQPTGAASALPQSILRQSNQSQGAVSLSSDSAGVSPGSRVTVKLAVGGITGGLSGCSFRIDYPAAALRLEDAGSLQLGALVPPSALALWNVSPGQDDYAKQDGTVYAALSSAAAWPANAGELAELTFTVLDAAGSRELLVQASEILVSNGFDVVSLASTETILKVQTPVGAEVAGVGYDTVTHRFTLRVKASVGGRYRVDVSKDLNSWSEIGTYTADAAELTVADPVAESEHSRFYRVLALPGLLSN